ncbi:MAG TPA: hypothetical protein VKU92_13630 [Acidimicrobiales bacterium]|nr:hypothetical protein [Acidimicrobiales bacterium]
MLGAPGSCVVLGAVAQIVRPPLPAWTLTAPPVAELDTEIEAEPEPGRAADGAGIASQVAADLAVVPPGALPA